jgi:hypothetical protein
MNWIEFSDKYGKTILIVVISITAILILCALYLNSIKTDIVDKEMNKRFIFCEGKSGRIPYDFICSKSGECSQQFLWCDYLNYLRSQNIADMNNLNYKNINDAYNEHFANGSMVVETK